MKDASVVCLLLTGPALTASSKTVEHAGHTFALLQSVKLVVAWFYMRRKTKNKNRPVGVSQKNLKNPISGLFSRLIHQINPVG